MIHSLQEDEHYYTVCRYVERNALRANLAPAAERWRWGGLHRWKHGTAKEKSLLAAWPLPCWPGWVEHVNGPQTEAKLAALRRCVQRGSPFGEGAWCDQIVRRLGLESTLRPKAAPKSVKTVPDTPILPLASVPRQPTGDPIPASGGTFEEVAERSDASTGARPGTAFLLVQQIQGALHVGGATFHDVQVDHRGLDVLVPQQLLHPANILSVLQQVSGKAVPLMPSSA